VLDDIGRFWGARSGQANNWIKLEFRGEQRERFSVKVARAAADISEDFVIEFPLKLYREMPRGLILLARSGFIIYYMKF
jgi:hypothetical protein